MGVHGVHSTFDFDGALNLARGMWDLAGTLEDVDGRRRVAGAEALRHWQGRYAREASHSMTTASQNAGGASQGLRGEAHLLAQRWADEWLKEANARFQDAVNAAHSHRNALESAWDWAFGSDEHTGSAPSRPPVPQPPAFAPTAALPTYDFG